MILPLLFRARDLLLRHELPLTFAAAPLFLFPSTTRALAVLLLLLPYLARDRQRIFPTPVTVTLLVLGILTALSLLVSPVPLASLSKVLGTLYGIACFFAIVRWIAGGERQARISRPWFVGIGGAYAVFALLTTDWIPKFGALTLVTDKLPQLLPQLEGADRGLHPNGVGGLLLLFLPPLIVFAFDRSSSSSPQSTLLRWFSWVALPLVSVTLILTQSRSAWVGCAIGLWGLAWFYGHKVRLAAAAILLAGLAIAIAVGPEGLTKAAVSYAGPSIESDAVGRRQLWSRAIAITREFPLTGVGLNMFRHVVPTHYPTSLHAPELRQETVHAHNQWLQVSSDLGLPGLVVYVALWLGLGHSLILGYRAAGSVADRRLVAGLAMAFVAHAIYGTSDAIALGAKMGLLFWIVLAFAVGTSLRLIETAGPRPVRL